MPACPRWTWLATRAGCSGRAWRRHGVRGRGCCGLPRVELSTRRLLLTDAGPLVALALPTDQSHARCVATLRRLRQVMVTTWPAFTEASFLVWREMGWHGQDRLWEFVRRKQLV